MTNIELVLTLFSAAAVLSVAAIVAAAFWSHSRSRVLARVRLLLRYRVWKRVRRSMAAWMSPYGSRRPNSPVFINTSPSTAAPRKKKPKF